MLDKRLYKTPPTLCPVLAGVCIGGQVFPIPQGIRSIEGSQNLICTWWDPQHLQCGIRTLVEACKLEGGGSRQESEK
jgi:hypothetical protein